MDAFRNFFFRLFAEDESQRRFILKQWHSPYPVSKKKHPRLADVFEEFVVNLLYKRPQFKLRQDHFCFFGEGSDALAVRFDWLGPWARHFIIYTAFAQRETLFKSRREFENNQFAFDGFIHDGAGICELVWQRQLVRDFAWLTLAKREPYIVLELISALQSIMLTHERGRRDMFVASLHYCLQGRGNVKEVVCWGLDWNDLHPEDVQQRILYKDSKWAPTKRRTPTGEDREEECTETPATKRKVKE